MIRLPLKEMEDFHAVLYMVYHYYMPQDSLKEVKVSVRQFQEKMAVLNKAVLSSRFKRKKESFAVARNQLDKAIAEFAVAVGSNQSEKIKAAVEEMHTRYRALARIFE